MNDHCDREDYLFTTPHTYAPLGTTGRATYDTTYTLNCQRCGSIHLSPDGFAPLCPRCQQLAALEAEIGRAVIGAGVIFHSINPAIDELIAQWRKLHAEGAPQ